MADLITLSQYKTLVGKSSTNDDTRLTEIIGSVTDIVRSYCGRNFTDFASSDKTEYLSLAEPEKIIYLDEYPILSITSIAYSTDMGQSYTTYSTSEDGGKYFIDQATDNTVVKYSGTFQDGVMGLKVIYKGGYTSLPEDLILACVDLVTYYFKKESTPSKSLRGESISNKVSSRYPAHITRILDSYRRFV